MFRAQDKSSLRLDNTQSSMSLTMKVAAAAVATCLAHPFRVLLNEASVNTNPVKTFKGAYYKLSHDVGINILRGTSATFLQLSADNYANAWFGHNRYLKPVAGIIATVFTGVTVMPIEMIFMRQNARRINEAAHASQPESIKSTAAFFLTNGALLKFSTARELGFCLYVYGAKDLDFYQKIPILLPSALITAIAYKLAAIEITKDIRQIKHLVPDYSIGFSAVFKNIAYGNVYLHESFRVPIQNPKKTSQLAVNFFSATCGFNMYFWRLTYLAVFSTILSFVKKEVCRLRGNECSGEMEERDYGMSRDC